MCIAIDKTVSQPAGNILHCTLNSANGQILNATPSQHHTESISQLGTFETDLLSDVDLN